YHQDSDNTILPPPPIIIDDEEQYIVEKILDARTRNKKVEYFVHWEGYSIADRTWETLDNLNCRRLLIDFYTNNPNKLGKEEFKRKYPTNHGLMELSP